jgi:hypothetical protein
MEHGNQERDITPTSITYTKVVYCNKHYVDNTCGIGKTCSQILQWYQQHNNINVLERVSLPIHCLFLVSKLDAKAI